jgi:DNA-binding CsgD family transcriptional regulator
MSRDVQTAMDLSYQLCDLPDRATYLSAAASTLLAMVGGDDVAWNNLDVAVHSAEVWIHPPNPGFSSETLVAFLDEHPLVAYYRARPGDFAPRRISDCVPDLAWRSSRVFRELFVPVGARYQLAMVVARGRTSGRNWSLNRSTCDFTDTEVDLARAVQPMLTLLDAIYAPDAGPEGIDARREEARLRAGLTACEYDMLTLLDRGLSAKQMARLRRISVGTVKKHLENMYNKLDCHDRLLVVKIARQRGLL